MNLETNAPTSTSVPTLRTPPPAAAPGQGQPTTLVELWEASLYAFAERELFIEKHAERWLAMSYRDVGVMIDEVRAGLAGLGVKQGDRIGIIAGNRSEWAVVAYAAFGLGAVMVPMYETQRPKDWVFIARDAGLSLLVAANPTIAAAISSARPELPTLRHLVVLTGEARGGVRSYAALRDEGRAAPVPATRPTSDDIACLMYTSGTTGDPKGVVLSHGNVTSNVFGLRSVIPLEAQQRTLSFLPWAHALGHTVELHMLIAAGASTGIAESIEQLQANLLEVRPTVLVAVPRVFQRIYAGVEKLMATKPLPVRWLYRSGLRHAHSKRNGARLGWLAGLVLALCDRVVFSKIRARFGGRLQFAVSGAAALAKEVAEFVESLGIAVYEGYGLTETSPVVSANVPGMQRLGSVGRPIPGVRVHIDQSFSADGRDGEIVVYGPNVMQGYHQRPEETAAMIGPDGGLRTGDLGYLDADGYLYITGRIKELYKLANGKYVAPAPLEDRIKLSPLVGNCMVFGDNRSCNIALVVPDLASARGLLGEVDLATAARSEVLRQRIEDEIDRLSEGWKGYERIRAVALLGEDFTLDNGLLTPSLKLKRRYVIARHATVIEAAYRQLGGGEAGEPGS